MKPKGEINPYLIEKKEAQTRSWFFWRKKKSKDEENTNAFEDQPAYGKQMSERRMRRMRQLNRDGILVNDNCDEVYSKPTKHWYCYILASSKAKYSNDTYIGVTNNPMKRILQHNRFTSGGARSTRMKGPWHFVMTIAGFPNKKTVLQAEWKLKYLYDWNPEIEGPIGQIKCIKYCF